MFLLQGGLYYSLRSLNNKTPHVGCFIILLCNSLEDLLVHTLSLDCPCQ